MGSPLPLGLSRCRKYITGACASTRHASVLCTADGHTHTCAHEGAMYTHWHGDALELSAPSQASLFSGLALLHSETHVGSWDFLVGCFQGRGYLSPAHLPLETHLYEHCQ